jgi:hypothetical protein
MGHAMEDDLKKRRAQLEAEHAGLWRAITMSQEWRRLQVIEGQLELLQDLLKDENPADKIHLKNGK